MKPANSQKISLGIFAVAGVAIFFAIIFFIGSKRNLFTRSYFIYGTFRNVGGLQIGNNVRFSGIEVGSVTGINIENDSTIKVTLKLKERIHRFIKSDAMASIGSDGLMGDKLINISPGPAGDKILADGGQIRTANPVDFDKIINRISRTADNAEAITSSLAGIAGEINSGKGSIGRLIYSDSLERGLETTVSTAHQTMKTARETIKSAKKGVEGFNENMEAMKHNFLLKGYYKKKAKEEKRRTQENNDGK